MNTNKEAASNTDQKDQRPKKRGRTSSAVPPLHKFLHLVLYESGQNSVPRFHPTPQEPVRSSWISGRGKDYGREGNSFCLLEEPFQGIFMVLTATRTMQMYANVYMWSTCGHNRTKTSLWQIVHLHAFKFIMHLSPHTARLASQAFSNLPPRAFRLRMLRLKASHGKSKSFHQAGSIPEWPEALCHNSADALPESKVEQESALVKYIYILYIKMQCGIQSYCHIQILCGQCSKFMG